MNNEKKYVFDSIQRSDDSPKKNIESYFQFYNRSSRKEIDRVRVLIEDFISRFPKKEVKELIDRIHSGDDIHFKSATFELFLHEALLRQNFKLTPHPTLPNENRSKPDFLVRGTDGAEFYLEAVLATENNNVDLSGEKRKGAVLDTLRSNPHDNFLLEIEDEGYPSSQPSGKKLVRKIHNWLDALNPDEIQDKIDENGLDSVEQLLWSHENWDVLFRPIPLKPEKRTKSKNLIAISGIGGGWVDHWSPIRDAIKFKGTKYGTLGKPFIIAVNMNSFYLSKIDEMQALFGQEQFIFQEGNSGGEPIMERAPNGAWYGKKGPQYTRVSGLWIFNDLHPTSLPDRKQTIYYNPWAKHPLPDSLKCFPHAILNKSKGKMRWEEGISFKELFDLNEGWPELCP